MLLAASCRIDFMHTGVSIQQPALRWTHLQVKPVYEVSRAEGPREIVLVAQHKQRDALQAERPCDALEHLYPVDLGYGCHSLLTVFKRPLH